MELCHREVLGFAIVAAVAACASPAFSEIDIEDRSRISLASGSLSPLKDPAPVDPVVAWGPPPHSEYYFRVSGLVLDPQGDGMVLPGGDPVELDVGGGVSFAFGYRFPGAPFSLEFEYAYRYLDADGLTGADDGDVSVHSLVWNALFDYPDLIGPVGVYAGAGIGFNINQFAFASSGGQGSAAVDGAGFFWQAMAGVTISVHPRAQILGGIRWSDAGEIEDDSLRVDSDMINYELGIRFFF